MKKLRILLVVLIAAATVQTSFGQAQLAVGIKGGLNFASINASSSVGENYNNRTGFHAGAFFLAKFGKIGLQPELIFSQQGTKLNFNSQNLDQNFSYVNIPVILKLYLIGGLNLQAGPQFGFLTSANGDTYNQNGVIVNQDIKDQVKSSDVSVGLGAGWDLPFGLTVDARYNLGVTNNSSGTNTSNMKNQVFQVSAGFKLIKFGK